MPTADLLPALASDRTIRIVQNEPANIGIMRFNHPRPPFDNPAIRRALLGAVSQTDAMTAIAGDQEGRIQDQVGLFAHEMALASDAGIEALSGPRDFEKVRRGLAEAGYAGERIVLLDAADLPVIRGIAQVGADELRRAGTNVDLQSMDFGTVISRRTSKEPVDKNGWSVLFAFMDGVTAFNPFNNFAIAANGAKAWFGWPSSDRIDTGNEEPRGDKNDPLRRAPRGGLMRSPRNAPPDLGGQGREFSDTEAIRRIVSHWTGRASSSVITPREPRGRRRRADIDIAFRDAGWTRHDHVGLQRTAKTAGQFRAKSGAGKLS